MSMLDVICAFKRCDIDLEQNHRLHIRHKLDLFDLTGKPEHVTHGDGLFQQRGWGNEIEQAAASPVDIEAIKGDGGGRPFPARKVAWGHQAFCRPIV